MNLVPVKPSLFFSKNDPLDPRLGEVFKPTTFDLSLLSKNDFAILGYPDDEGIKLNSGRPGASEAPQSIRQILYKMTVPSMKNFDCKFWDLGDLEIKNELAERHEKAKLLMEQLQQKKIRTISFGGGHDYGYADTSAFVKASLQTGEKPLVINFDAHLDVRPTHHGFNSGTPFYRLLSEYENDIDLVEIGLQPQCNSAFHRDWALHKKANLFDLKDVQSDLLTLFEKPLFKKITKTTPVFISFDIDCLSSSEAGGCSQSWVTGLKTQDCLHFLKKIYQICDCRGLGIYEVSPPLDQDFRTSKTAALLAYYFIFQDLV